MPIKCSDSVRSAFFVLKNNELNKDFLMTIKLSKPFAPNSAVDEFDARQLKKSFEPSWILSTLRKNWNYRYS